MQSAQEKNLFDEFGLELTTGEVQIGKVYPIFGMVTKLISIEAGTVIAEINHNIIAHLKINNEDRIETLKERCFDSGIFVSKIRKVEPQVEVDCQTIIFGKKAEYNA